MFESPARKKQKRPSVEYVEVPEEYRYVLTDCLWEQEKAMPQLDLDLKSAVLSVSSFVVAVRSFSGECSEDYEYLHQCSGVIVSCDQDGYGGYHIDVVTAAMLLANSDAEPPVLAPDLKIRVRSCNGHVYHGVVTAHDFHYNVAVIKFKSDIPFQSVNFKHVHVNPIHLNLQFQLKHHCSSGDLSQVLELSPGEKVVALGRDFDRNILLAEEGAFSILQFKLDCQELLMTSCKTYMKFSGGPLINHVGDVIGVIFCLWGFSAFLPSNIVYRYLERLKRERDMFRPYHGMRLRDLYALDVALLEKIVRNPAACRGVIVEKVKKGSPAELAGILPYDAIIQFGGSTVESSLKQLLLLRLFESLALVLVEKCGLYFSKKLLDSTWDKIGESVEVEVIRSNGEHEKLSLAVEDTDPHSYNRWPPFDD